MTAIVVPGSTGQTYTQGINTSGEVVGEFTPKGSTNSKGFLYSGGKYTILDGPPETNGWTRALGINSANPTVIVGDFLAAPNRYRGYMYTKSGGYSLFDYDTTNSTSIFAINDSGDIAGAFGSNVSPVKGFAVIKGTKYEFNGSGSDVTYAYGINKSDDVVGIYIDSKNLSHGFLRAPSGKITAIDYPGAKQTICFGITAAQEITGTYYNSHGQLYGFTYLNGKYTTSDFAEITGMNAGGDITGAYFGPDGVGTGMVAEPQPFSLANLEVPTQYSRYGDIITGINNAGVMVGGYNDASGNTHGLMISGSQVTTIDNPEGVQTQLFAINSSGEIVGDSYDIHGNAHGFLYSKGTFTSVPGPSGASTSDATGINDNGWIAGDFVKGKDSHAFLLKGSTYQQLDVPGASNTYAAGLNKAGDVVLAYPDAKGTFQSSLYRGTGGYESIDVPGADENFAASINSAGDIVYRVYDVYGVGHAALKKGNDYYIFDFPGGENSGAQGINDSGKMVGFYSPAGKPSEQLLFDGTE